MIFNPPFIKKLVNAGEPVTSQAWNDIVNGLGQVHGYLETTEATALRLRPAGRTLNLGSGIGIEPRAIAAELGRFVAHAEFRRKARP